MARGLHSFCVAIFLTVLSTRAAFAGELVEVFIDARDPAYVVIQGVSSDTPQIAWQEMEGYAQLDKVQMMSWLIFRKDARTILSPYVKRNDYPNTQALMGVLTLLKKYPGRPFAVTWNGGVAVSFWDYQHAAQTLETFRSNPKGYKPLTQEEDPVNPKNSLPGLLRR
ncbi:MAG: hypothetical protein COB46_09480 [Rhodospirillaceae bacterium]|nr:MAG: hypothetical protein COB46_09480 [Rhodospirillaceae bacterium]